jgi:hypothetical protein
MPPMRDRDSKNTTSPHKYRPAADHKSYSPAREHRTRRIARILRSTRFNNTTSAGSRYFYQSIDFNVVKTTDHSVKPAGQSCARARAPRPVSRIGCGGATSRAEETNRSLMMSEVATKTTTTSVLNPYVRKLFAVHAA